MKSAVSYYPADTAAPTRWKPLFRCTTMVVAVFMKMKEDSLICGSVPLEICTDG